MISIRVTNSKGTNTEGLIHSPRKPTETNEMMKLERTREASYSIGARNDIQQLELTSYYSTDPQMKGTQLEDNNAVVSSLGVLQVCYCRSFVYVVLVFSLTTRTIFMITGRNP